MLYLLVDQSDPFCTVSGKHFNHMLKRYGSPVILLNLVKVCGAEHRIIYNICHELSTDRATLSMDL